MSLSGKIAVVTGAGRGIGLAIAEAIAQQGAHVVLTARTEAEIKSAAENIVARGGSASAIACDVSKEAEVSALGSVVLERYTTVDVLVNNAGMGIFKPVHELSVADFDTMWNVNMRGVFMVTRVFLDAMMKAKKGDIVNIASLAGKNTFKTGAGYAATKWALRGFSGSLMLEAREHNIRVATICPGSVDTQFSAAGKTGENIPKASDVADAVLFCLNAPGRTMFSEIDIRPTRP